MEEWKEYKLGDLCYNVCSGGTPKSTYSAYYEGGKIPWLNTKEINYNRIYSTESHITEEGLNNSSAKWIDANSVIVAMYGATAGRVAIAKVPMTTNQACCNLMIDSSKADYNYIYYYLSNSYKQLLGMANGAAQQNLNAQVIKDFIISLPDIQEQRNIATILSSLDSKIAVNKKICENLEAQAQALFKHWFVDFAPFKDGKFVESELGLIPEGWRAGTLSDLGEIVGGATPSKAESTYFTDKGIAWLTPKDLSNDLKKFTSRGEIDITEEGYNSCSAKIMPRGSVLFSSRAPIGYITIAKNNICTNQGFKSVVPNYAGTAYIYYLLKLNTKRIENMSSGTTFKEASGALMKSLAVLLPPKSALDAFESKVLDIFNEQEVLETESTRLSSLRDTLLPKLMSGEIKVNEITL